MKERASIAATLAYVLAEAGARRCFGVLGTANFAITHALTQNGVKYLPAMHEAQAVMMAFGYAHANNEMAIASLHSGPGLTNALTAIAEAAKSKAPMLVLAGDVANGDLKNNFHFEQAEMVRSVGAVAERIYSPATALDDFTRAIKRVLRDRSTVVISLPEDVQKASFDGGSDVQAAIASIKSSALLPQRIHPDPLRNKALADLVEQSKYPLILAGRGAVVSGSKRSLLALGEQIGAIFATTLQAHGLFIENDWSVGISGGFASEAALQLLPECDLVLGFGASYTHWTTRQHRLISHKAKIVQIDCDLSRLGRNDNSYFEVLGDADLTACALQEELLARGHKRSVGWRSKETQELIADSARQLNAKPTDAIDGPDHIDPRLLTIAINDLLPKDRLVVTDSGHFMGWPPLHLAPADSQGWCMPSAFQVVGLGMGCAVGAALAQPDRITVLTVGDGGLLMSMSDFATLVSSGLRVCVVVYNDSAYGAEVHYFENRGYDCEIAKLPRFDFAAIAKGFGIEAISVRSTNDLHGLKEWVSKGAPGVFLVDAHVDPKMQAEWFTDAFVEPTPVGKARAISKRPVRS